jgi:hypothetical protein
MELGIKKKARPSAAGLLHFRQQLAGNEYSVIRGQEAVKTAS